MSGTIKSRLAKLEKKVGQQMISAERERYFEWLRAEAKRIRREDPEYVNRLREEAMRLDAMQTTENPRQGVGRRFFAD
ncbi:MAG TPA: hypothetical protein VMV10_08170 [Pirellulales bacterium]|nr:hypothetical protein [Pirellulales bacterium]